MSMILCILDMRPNRHYTLERLPVIQRTLKDESVRYINIYDFEKQFGRFKYPDKINQIFYDFVMDNNITTIITAIEWVQYISVETLFSLKKNGVVISSFIGDDEDNYFININYLGLMTVPISYSKIECDKYNEINPNTQRIPVSISMHDSEKYLKNKKSLDVIFVGRIYSNRVELLKCLYDNGVNITVYGNESWGRHFDGNIYKGYLNNSDYYNEISRAKIVLAFLESPQTKGVVHVTAKPFDAAKTGTALVATRYKDFFEKYELKEGVDLLAYSTKEELLSKVNELLSNDEKRLNIANSLRNKIKTNYDYDNLYKNLFKYILNTIDPVPPVKTARILYLNPYDALSDNDLERYDYVIYKNKQVEYSQAIEEVLAGHIYSKKFLKLDSVIYGEVARKIFNYIDIPSLAIPVSRVHEIKKTKGLVRINDSMQTYLPLNRYKGFDLYVFFLVIIRVAYKKIRG